MSDILTLPTIDRLLKQLSESTPYEIEEFSRFAQALMSDDANERSAVLETVCVEPLRLFTTVLSVMRLCLILRGFLDKAAADSSTAVLLKRLPEEVEGRIRDLLITAFPTIKHKLKQ